MNSHNYGNGSENVELEMMTCEVRSNGVSSLAIANTVTVQVGREFLSRDGGGCAKRCERMALLR